MNFKQLSKFVHTLRYVRPIQVANRIRRRLIKTQPSTEPAPPRRRVEGRWTPAAARRPNLVAPHQQRVFQTLIAIDNPTVWNDSSLSHLVRYNLHYFDDLNAEHTAERTLWHRDLITRWIRENSPATGTGWEPYPTSLRIVNWIKWCLAGHDLDPLALNSLAVQTRSLRSQLEYHLLGNHLLANAKALVFAGAFFSGDEANRWLNQGVQILRAEVAEQILNDGGHFELSPMYHCVVLEDLLDILNLAKVFPDEPMLKFASSMQDTINQMRRWLKTMCHPDGEISFFNDAAHEIACSPQELESYAERLTLPTVDLPADRLIQLPDSGYIRVQFENHVALLDVARVGPSYQPGHAHADTLSFEWSFNGKRVLVNSGTSCYGISDERERQRSTAAHNTVEIDGEDSSEVWSGFRVARRARPTDLQIDEQPTGVEVACSHTGYQRLPGRVTHRRAWKLGPREISISDHLTGRWQTAIARLHIHPDWKVSQTHQDQFEAALDEHKLQLTVRSGRVETTTYHPEFEVSLPTSVIEAELQQANQTTCLRW